MIESGGIDDDAVEKVEKETRDESKNKQKESPTKKADNDDPPKESSSSTIKTDTSIQPIMCKPRTMKDPLEKEIYAKDFLDDDLSSSDESKNSSDTKKSKASSSKKDNNAESKNDDSDVEIILDVSMFENAKKKEKQIDIATLLTSVQAKKPRPPSSIKKDDDCIELSSDSDDELEELAPDEEERTEKGKKPRAILSDDQLTDETKQAQKEESDRVKRLNKKNDMLTQRLSQSQSLSQTIEDSECILDYDSKRKVNISVHPEIVKHLKPHQVEGVKFVYDSCYGAVDQIEKYPGSGCILAHCMGLGKTLQLIAVLHTLIRYPQLKTNRILVVCPKSTVMNWSEEIKRWLGPIRTGPKLKVLFFPDNS